MDKRILLGQRIRELRKRIGLSQEKLSELIDVDPTTISNIENGKNYPSLINLENITKVLNISFLDVFDFEHQNHNDDLIKQIIAKLNQHPDKIKDFYKIVVALTK